MDRQLYAGVNSQAQNANLYSAAQQASLSTQAPQAPGHTSTVLNSLHSLGDTLAEASSLLSDTKDRLFGSVPEAGSAGQGLFQVRAGVTGDIEGYIEHLSNRARLLRDMASELHARL